jgi:hypothetical protein
VRRAGKILIWVAVFAACAGVGAFVAAHTDPFPPGVEDPGAVSPLSPTPSVSPTPTGPRWAGGANAQTRHVLFVGGSCASDWQLRLTFGVNVSGAVQGTGLAKRHGELRCDFPTAQIEARTIALRVGGHQVGSTLHLTLATTVFAPTGSGDFGGFTHTLVRFPPLVIRGASAEASGTASVSDGDRGHYLATFHAHLFCLSGC